MHWCVYSRPEGWEEMQELNTMVWQFRGNYRRLDTALAWAARLLFDGQEVGLEPLRDLANITTTRASSPSCMVLALPWTRDEVREMLELDEGNWGSD
jgi:hypothetical protein